MTGWGELAQAVLTHAASAGVPVERTVITAGPGFARDCRMIAVFPDIVRAEDISTRSRQVGLNDFGPCAWVPQIRLVVAFVADCAPLGDETGQPPSATRITEWTQGWLDDAAQIWDALADMAETGIGDLGCRAIRLGEVTFTGPSDGAATALMPVQVTVTGDPNPQPLTPPG